MNPQIESAHFLHYDLPGPVTASALAESLLGLDGVIKRSAVVVGALMEVHVKIADVEITGVELGSYKEHFLVRMVFGKGKAAEKNIDKLRRKLAVKNLNVSHLFTAILGGAIVYVALKNLPATESPAKVHIENSFNTFGQQIGMTGAELQALIAASVRNPADLQRHVVRLTHPNGNEASGTLVFDKNPLLTIPKEAIATIPHEYDREEVEPFRDLNNVDIIIRAADLDRAAMGWAAIAPEISDKRLPVRLEEGIDPMKLTVGRYTKVDLTVQYRTEKDGSQTPKRYLLRKLHAETQTAAQ